MNIIVINLHNKPERLNNALNELRKVKFSSFVTRLDAVDMNEAKLIGSHYITDIAYNNILNINNTNIMPNYASVGCAISHINCWRYIINNNIANCIIVEDDIVVNDIELFNIDMSYLSQLINKTHNPMFVSFNSILLKSSVNKVEHINAPFFGTHFYYVNTSMARYLYDNLKILTYQIDIEIGLLAQKTCMYNYTFINNKTTSIEQTKKFKSDIQTYLISMNDLLNCCNYHKDVLSIIYEYIPDCCKKERVTNLLLCDDTDMFKHIYYLSK